jgi:hypothetical protein
MCLTFLELALATGVGGVGSISNIMSEEHFPRNPAEMYRIAMNGRSDTRHMALRPFSAGAPIVRIPSPRQVDESVRRRLGVGPVIRVPPCPRNIVPSVPYLARPPSTLYNRMGPPSARSGDESVNEERVPSEVD